MKKITKSFLFVMVIGCVLSLSLYIIFWDINKRYHFEHSFRNGRDGEIRIYSANAWEVTRPYLYEVLHDAKIINRKVRFYNSSMHNPVKFYLLESSESQLCAVYEASDPLILLILHDFGTGESWPYGEMDEHYSEILARGQKLLERFRKENPGEDYSLNLY